MTDFHSKCFQFFPNQACLWGSYSKERISVRVVREGGSPVTLGPVPPKILVPRSWYKTYGECKPPASGGLEAPQEQKGVWGAAAPQ